jgi:uncharacterized protein (DUF433 family)
VIFDRITVEVDKMAGQPCIRGLRVPVATVVAMAAAGTSTAEILADLPEFDAEDAAQVLRYAAAGDEAAGNSMRSRSRRRPMCPAGP